MKGSIRLLFIVIISLCFSQTANAQITVKWPSTKTWTFSYSSGVLSGATLHTSFSVTSGSGYIDLVESLESGVSTANGSRTIRMWVEAGGEYGVKVSVGYSSRRNANPSQACFRVRLDSPDFSPSTSSSQDSAFSSSQAIWYCPNSVFLKAVVTDDFQLNASDGIFWDHVRLTWNEIADATSYQVFRCTSTSDGTCGTSIGSTADHVFSDTEGVDEKIYYYRVKSCIAGECSGFSPSDRGHRTESLKPPDAPTGVSATDGTITGRVRVTWNAVENTAKYKIYRCTSSETGCQQFGAPRSTSFYHTPDPDDAETTFWYRVKACTDNLICSAYSEADTGYSRAPLPNGACDEAFVQMDNSSTVISVAPTGIDDTVNIQCALDTATSAGYPTVRLGKDTYYISNLLVEGFKGSFEGTSQAATLLEVIDSSFNCSLMSLRGRVSAAIKFANGEPRVRYMTIRANMPCLSFSRHLDSVLHFTGESTKADNCDNDVIFAAVDRVIIDGTSIDDGPRVAVSVDPEGQWHWKGGCKDTLLGTFKLNRSAILNTRAGLRTSMKAGAQVDINFNEFRGNLEAVTLTDTNQNTTITTNKFFGDNTEDDWYFGIIATTFSDDPPPSSRLVVHNNEFNVASSFDELRSNAVSVRFDLSGSGVISKIDSIISNNKFNLSGNGTYGIRYHDTSNTHVSGNRFSGSGARAIIVEGETPVSGWDITANKGLENFSSFYEEDIRLFTNTSNCIVGPGQGASVQDDGLNNVILPQ